MHVCKFQRASMEPRHPCRVARCLDFVALRLAPFDGSGLCGHNWNLESKSAESLEYDAVVA
jgi:hypothetical protein